ncbi:hypothetical protein [Haloferula sp.]|uniref:hypothetical protein n=1 Tax=Haloferula sp. TaxID=2497595 RepID=UPI00329EEDB4
MDSDSLQLRELVPAEPFIQSTGWPWWAWLVVAVFVIGLILLIFAAFRRKDSITPPELGLVADRAYKIAMDHLKQAGDRTVIQEAATACSAAIRHYLATVTGDRSLFETHEEFLARHEALNGYPVEVRNEVSNGFSKLAQLKYGKSPSGDSTEVANDGRNLLQQLHQHRPA